MLRAAHVNNYVSSFELLSELLDIESELDQLLVDIRACVFDLGGEQAARLVERVLRLQSMVENLKKMMAWSGKRVMRVRALSVPAAVEI